MKSPRPNATVDRKKAKEAAKDYATAFSHGELCAAAHNGKLEIVQRLISGGESPNSTNRFGKTPLMHASENGHIEIVKWLTEQGAEINYQTPKCPETGGRLSALHFAAQKGQTSVIQRLVERGANINSLDGDGVTPLVHALFQKRIEAAEQLLILGADAGIVGNQGETAIGAAVMAGAHRMVEMLLARGVDIQVIDPFGQGLLHIAASNNDSIEVSRFISLGLPVDQLSSVTGTPLIYACLGDAIDAARILLESRASVNAVLANEHGWTALFYAIAKRSSRMVDLLLRYGADVNLRCKNPLAGSFKNTSEFLTARQLASRHPDPEVIRLLDAALKALPGSV